MEMPFGGGADSGGPKSPLLELDKDLDPPQEGEFWAVVHHFRWIITERVNTAKLRPKVIPIFASKHSFEANNNEQDYIQILNHVTLFTLYISK